MRRIVLKNFNKEVIVDKEDFGYLNRFNWTFRKNDFGDESVYRNINNKIIFIHEMIIPIPQGCSINHINGNRLDNRKSNLETIRKSTRNYLRKHNKVSSSVYRGVYKTPSNRFASQIRKDGKVYYLGTFVSEIDAATAYDKKANELYGKYAFQNVEIKLNENRKS